MRIWLVGKSGMLAGSFEKLLKARSIDFFATDRDQVNICDVEEVSAVSGYTHIMNCAAYTAVDRAEEEPALAYAVNSDGAHNLAKAAKAKRAKLIHFSTDYVFDGTKTSPYVEEDVPNPQSVYGKSKWAGEQSVLAVCPENLVIRTSWLFGEGRENFVKSMARLMQEKETLRVVADQRGRPTFCDDLAGATLALIEQSGIFHYANAGETSWFAFAEAIKELLPEGSLRCKNLKPIKAEEYPLQAPRPSYSVLSTKKAEAFTVARNWKEGLKSYVHQLT